MEQSISMFRMLAGVVVEESWVEVEECHGDDYRESGLLRIRLLDAARSEICAMVRIRRTEITRQLFPEG